MTLIHQSLVIGWIPSDWSESSRGDTLICCGDPNGSGTAELSLHLEHDDNQGTDWVPNFTAEMTDSVTGQVTHKVFTLSSNDNWWSDSSSLWSSIAKFSFELSSGTAKISGAQLAGCWRILNNESDDDEHEQNLGLQRLDSSCGEFDNERLEFNGMFYAHYTISCDGDYDDDEEQVILIKT